MNISGVVVRTFPRDIERVTRALTQLGGVEVHGANEDGRLVVTVEQAGEAGLTDVLNEMQSTPGVLSTSLIYHQFEDLALQEDTE